MDFRQWIEQQTPVIKNVVQTPQGFELRFDNPSLNAALTGMAPMQKTADTTWWIKTTKNSQPFQANSAIPGWKLYDKWRSFKGWETPKTNKMTLYRGIAGEFIPYSANAKQERSKYLNIINSHFGGQPDSKEEVAWLKKMGYWPKVFALSRMDQVQGATTSLQAAINYATKTAARVGLPPKIIAIDAKLSELPPPMGSVGSEIFDIPAQDFANLFHNNGRILSIEQAYSTASKTI